ncbi:TetR/AcrR family transcriptional regulator [Clostridium sp. MD294]|uniref:TetR/AcrR family transcriptional regulator n=1 Tax=Clostridium sp. MD294 TaxID=97138 RepID=UPI0002CB2636|nr:TetR/AcrR family transcriptional regulator [Clostridium sp. MD294]USF29549.1 hypothetical protein C820_000949 [Clostridium sp. MD294]
MKKNIIKIAFQVFLKNGFAGVSTNEIIRKANITKGCFYHYFKNKDDLIYNVIVTYLYPYLESSTQTLEKMILENKEFNIAQNIYDWYTFMPKLIFGIEENVSFREIQFLIYEGMKKYLYLSKKSCECNQKQHFLLKGLLEKGKKDGIIAAEIDTDVYATTMIALKYGMVALHILDNNIDTEEKWENTFRVIWSEIEAISQTENSDKGGYFYAEAVL